MTRQREGDEGRTRTLVLNGLRDLATGERAVLADEQSAHVLEDALETVTDEAERERVRASLERATAGDAGDPAVDAALLERVVDAVADELVARGATLVLDHDVRLDLSTERVALHRFFESGDPALLDAPVDGEPLPADVDRGVEAAGAGEYEAAVSAFEDTLAGATEAHLAGSTRVLLAWASLQAGDEERALEAVRDALRADEDDWTARLVGVAADHSNPEWFREGRLTSEPYLRVRAAVPDRASVEAAVLDDSAENGRDDGGSGVTWLPGSPACFRIPRLRPSGRVRLRLRGPPHAVPALHAYYLAVGVVEPESARPRTVEATLLDGPATARTTERFAIRLPHNCNEKFTSF